MREAGVRCNEKSKKRDVMSSSIQGLAASKVSSHEMMAGKGHRLAKKALSIFSACIKVFGQG